MHKHKKYFGQHFLHDQTVLNRIAESINELPKSLNLLEIGPGEGALTSYLILLKFTSQRAVEIDNDLITFLKGKYPSIDIIHADFLKYNNREILPNTALVGNFPYNISSQIVFKMLESKDKISHLVGMFQKEMALRICARPNSKDYGIISILSQAFYQCEYLFDIDRSCFKPPPQVQSGIIKMVRNQELSLPCDEQLFINLVKTTFNNRRKMLRNTLHSFFPADALQDIFYTKRPENLSVQDFIHLTLKIQAIKNERQSS